MPEDPEFLTTFPSIRLLTASARVEADAHRVPVEHVADHPGVAGAGEVLVVDTHTCDVADERVVADHGAGAAEDPDPHPLVDEEAALDHQTIGAELVESHAGVALELAPPDRSALTGLDSEAGRTRDGKSLEQRVRAEDVDGGGPRNNDLPVLEGHVVADHEDGVADRVAREVHGHAVPLHDDRLPADQVGGEPHIGHDGLAADRRRRWRPGRCGRGARRRDDQDDSDQDSQERTHQVSPREQDGSRCKRLGVEGFAIA